MQGDKDGQMKEEGEAKKGRLTSTRAKQGSPGPSACLVFWVISVWSNKKRK